MDNLIKRPIKHGLCTCGHSYEHHGDDNECTKCAAGYCPHGYDETSGSLIVRLILPTEEEYAAVRSALGKFGVVKEVYLA